MFIYIGKTGDGGGHMNKWFYKSIHAFKSLRDPAPMKRPMICGSKIESADFYLPSRGYRILFKNEFLLFQFRFKPKISSHKLSPFASSKKKAENKPLQKNGSEITIATQNNKKNYTVLKKKAFNAMSFDKHRKTAKANKKLSLKHCIVNYR